MTCVIFLLGRLEDVYYGTSLKRIVIMCFGKIILPLYVILYIILIPLMVLSYYKKLWAVNAWLQVINYAYSIGVIVFITIISSRSTVIELIRNRTINQLEAKKFEKYTYNDERFAVLNMIRNLDYDDAWQCSMLQSIVVDMSITAIEKNRLYVMYNVIQLILQYAGYETKEEKNRIINFLNDINKSIVAQKSRNNIENKKLKEAVATIILPILQVDVKSVDGRWISQLVNSLRWVMRRDVSIILIFGAQYLYDCERFCELTVNELLDNHIELMTIKAPYAEEELSDEIHDCWLNLNMSSYLGMQKEKLCEEFVEDYITMDTKFCTTEMLRNLQARRLEKTGRQKK